MAGTYDFHILGDSERGRAVVADALRSQGYTLSTTPAGLLVAQRGSATMTVLFGGLSGSGLRMTFTVELLTDAQGQVIARFSRGEVGGMLSGGAIGAFKITAAFEQAAGAIRSALRDAGLLGDPPQR